MWMTYYFSTLLIFPRRFDSRIHESFANGNAIKDINILYNNNVWTHDYVTMRATLLAVRDNARPYILPPVLFKFMSHAIVTMLSICANNALLLVYKFCIPQNEIYRVFFSHIKTTNFANSDFLPVVLAFLSSWCRLLKCHVKLYLLFEHNKSCAKTIYLTFSRGLSKRFEIEYVSDTREERESFWSVRYCKLTMSDCDTRQEQSNGEDVRAPRCGTSLVYSAERAGMVKPT